MEQAGADLGQAQVKLEVIVKVGVEDRSPYLILSEFQTFPACGWVVGVENEINAISDFN